jgi:hypothetical protein
MNSTEKKKYIIEKSQAMSETEHDFLFDIVRRDSNKYTMNKNGVFVNLNFLNEATIDKMVSFVDFWKNKQWESEKSIEIEKENNIVQQPENSISNYFKSVIKRTSA